MGENEVVLVKWAKALIEKKPKESFNLEDYEVLVSEDMVEVVSGDLDVVTVVPELNKVTYHPQMEKSASLRKLVKKSLRELEPPVYNTVDDEIIGRALDITTPMPFRQDVDNYKVCVRSDVVEILRAGAPYATIYPTLRVCRLHGTFATKDQVKDVLASLQ